MSTARRSGRRPGHGLRPLLIDAATAHREGMVRYDGDGGVRVRHPELGRGGAPDEVVLGADRQFPAIRATFDDLNKALSRLASSPALEGGLSLRSLFEQESARYDELAAAAHAHGRFEPDYGTYVLDHRAGELYLVAPERWHRLALVTSNANLLVDPAGRLSWAEVRDRLEGAVIGFAGVSVGGNLLEGWLREARPRAVKLADPDWVEITNFNRGERMSLRHLVGSRARRFDRRNPYEVPRVSKAGYAAYEAQLVDPYLDCWVYEEGLTRENLPRFLSGDGGDEPGIDILVEEMDNLDLKVLAREQARERRIDVLMLSDFGHRPDLLWNYFHDHPASAIGIGGTDAELARALEATKSGSRDSFFAFATALCGPEIATDSFADFIAGRGEQPTSSMPQSGATAMASGAIGGKELALRVLGHHGDDPSPRRVIYDLLNRRTTNS